MKCCYASKAVSDDHAGLRDRSIGAPYYVPDTIMLVIVINGEPAALDLRSQVVEAGAAAPCTVYGNHFHAGI